jgi:PAS domain S-box-containing protein
MGEFMSERKDPPSTLVYNSSSQKRDGKKRRTGIEIIGDVAWGTHLCQFYKTKDDLIDILVPYFTKGLENNEFCMWITSKPLEVENAKKALKKTVKNLDDYIKKGQIEILDSTEWYTKSGKFDADEVLQGWIFKEKQALEKGFDGLRLSGNTFWLEKKDWKDFTKYEETINNVIRNYHIIALCSYSLDKCNASEIIDVVSNHQFALIKREGQWHRIESPEIKKVEEKLRSSEALLLNIAQSIPVQISISRASDGVILYTNLAYDRGFGYAEGDLIGRKAPDLYYDPSDRTKLINTLKKQGFLKDYEVRVKRSDGTLFWVSASIQPIIFAGESAYLGASIDITERKQATEMLRKAHDELETRIIERTTELKKTNEALTAERKRFNDVLETLPAYLVLLNKEYHVPFANKFFRERFGESHGQRCFEYLFKRNTPCENCRTYDALNNNAPLEWEWVGPDGHNYYVYDFPFTDSDGSPLIMEMGIDITKQKQAEEALRRAHDELEIRVKERTKELNESKQRLNNLYTAMNEGVCVHEIVYNRAGKPVDYKILDVNPMYEKITGLTKKFIVGKCATEIYQTGKPPYLDIYTKVALTGRPVHFETYFPPMKKHFNISVFSPEKGKFATVFSDITERKKAEEQLKETSDYLENLLNYANAPIIVWDKDFKIVRFNHAFEHLTGYSSEMMIGKKLDILFPQGSKKESYQKIRKTLSGEYWDSVEIPILRKDKDMRIVLWNSANIYDNNGKNLIATIAQGTDITERKKAEDAVLQAKLEWERTFDCVPDLIAILDKSHKIVRANKAMAQRLGIPPEQCVNLNCHMCVHGESKPPKFCPHRLTMSDGKEHIAEVYEDKLGGYFLVSTTPIFDTNGILLGSVHVARDITERKRSEEAIKESETRLKHAQEIAHLGSWELNLLNNRLSWSDEVYKIFGLQPQEFTATYEAFLEAVHPDDRLAVDLAYSDSVREGRNTYEIEHRIIRKNGEIRFVHEKCEHIRDESGKVIRSVGMVHDITEFKRTETELLRLASFPEKNPMPIVEIDLQGDTQYLNPTSKQLLSDLEKKGFKHPFLKGIKNMIPEIQEKGKIPVIREVHVSNKYYLQTINFIPENQRIRIYSYDITDRKKTEETLQESEEKYRRIVENTTNVIMVTQPDGIISYLSPSCKETIGYLPEELIGTNPMIFHPDDAEKVQQTLSRALKGEKGSNFEYRILTKTKDVKWISHSWSPIIIDNNIQSIISVIADITERKKTENKIKKLNDNLMRRSMELAAANKELEAFSYSVSHDLRAPLRSIDGFSQALLEDYTDVLDEQANEYLQRVRKASQRMGELIDDLLKLSRLTRTEMTIDKVDLHKTATTIIETFKKEEPTRKIDFIAHDKLTVDGDVNLLHILLENLLSNAWKFTKRCKRARIEFGKTGQGKETVFFIRDNGAGFDMKYANKLFIPFQRLHDEGEYPGTGIGLGIVSRIIHRHGGRIWAEGEENKGATFYFTLGGKIYE